MLVVSCLERAKGHGSVFLVIGVSLDFRIKKEEKGIMEGKAALRLLRYILVLWRFCAMAKQVMNVAKGIGMGVLAGVTVAAIGTKAMSGGRKKARVMKRNAGKAIHTVGNLSGDVEKMLK